MKQLAEAASKKVKISKFENEIQLQDSGFRFQVTYMFRYPVTCTLNPPVAKRKAYSRNLACCLLPIAI
jgi:hypothetical protein